MSKIERKEIINALASLLDLLEQEGNRCGFNPNDYEEVSVAQFILKEEKEENC